MISDSDFDAETDIDADTETPEESSGLELSDGEALGDETGVDRDDESNVSAAHGVSTQSEIDSLQPTRPERKRVSKAESDTDPATAGDKKPKSAKRRRRPREFSSEYVALQPQGISAASALGRPVLVLKDHDSGEVLPIWLQALDASVATAELSERSSLTPHGTARRVIEMLGGEVRRVIFKELIGHHQFAELVIVNHEYNRLGSKIRRMRTLRIRADEAMSFCLQTGAQFSATREFMARSREIDMDLAKLEYNLGEGLLPELKEELENSSRMQPYMM